MPNERIKEAREPLVVRGVGVGRGIAIAPLHFDLPGDGGDRRSIEENLLLLDRATDIARDQLLILLDNAIKSVGEEHGEIFRIYLSLLDGEPIEVIKKRIKTGDKLSLAIEIARERLVIPAERDGDRRARAHGAHIKEVLERLSLAADAAANEKKPDPIGSEAKKSTAEKYILVSSGEGSDFIWGPDPEAVLGIVCVGGSEGSGLAAYARAKGIPTLVISPSDAPSIKYEGSGAIIDPARGRLTIDPDLAALDKFAESTREAEERENRLAMLIGKPSVTHSGRHVSLFATVDEGDAAAAISSDAEGIGILKTDFLFDRESLEEIEKANLEEIKKAIDIFKEKPITVRAYTGGRGGEMGKRGIRFLLARRDIFKAQIRAVLRAASLSEISLAIPLAVSPDEVRRAKSVIMEATSELRSEGVPFGEIDRVGIMIDTPAAAINSDLLAAECDFFIADTDSLSTLTLAASRLDASMSEILRKNASPILRLVGFASKTLHASGKGKLMGVAGDLASDLSLTERFIEMGVDILSVSPPYILELREKVRQCP